MSYLGAMNLPTDSGANGHINSTDNNNPDIDKIPIEPNWFQKPQSSNSRPNSSSSSDSPVQFREVKSATELPLQTKNATKRYKKLLQKVDSKRQHSKQALNNIKAPKIIAYDNSVPKIPEDNIEQDNCYAKIKEVGNVNSADPFVCSLYITSYNALEDQLNSRLAIGPFAETVNKIASGRVRIQKTCCGLVAIFTREGDANKVMSLPLQKVFSGPVQVARFLTSGCRFQHNIIVKDIPWCISNREIYQALKLQGIQAGNIVRTRTHVKIELHNAPDMHRLLEEGLNFFNCTSFSVFAENTQNQGEMDIIQCFKCQGFWHTSNHCRHMPRCVRCGENHDVEFCPRPRSSPICCHCRGPHHAAYKMCPVRLRHINSTYAGFTLAKNRPVWL